MGGARLNVVVHYPQEDEKQRELKKRIAATHGDAVVRSIERLPCPTEQKLELLNQLLREGR